MGTVVSFKHEIEIIINREKSEVGLSNQLHSRRRTSQSLRGRNNKLCSPKKTATTPYHEVHCVFYFPISHLDFWMLGITEQ
jgi:hypothetical protein